MKNIVAALVLLTALTSFAGNYGCTFSSDLSDDTDLTFNIKKFDEKDQWDSSTTEPPLSPKKATDIATDYLKQNPFGFNMSGWSVYDINLTRWPGDKKSEYWVYTIAFEPKQKKMTVGGSPTVSVPVRMDGSIPEHKIKKRKKPNDSEPENSADR